MRYLKAFIMLSLLLFFLTACQASTLTDSDPSDQGASHAANDRTAQAAENNPAAIQISGPMTVSHNSLFSYLGVDIDLDVALIEGSYYEDWNPGALMGRNWQGSFQFVIRDGSGNVLRQFDIDRSFFQQVNEIFELSFADYNGDGDIDFALGQYGTSNGNYYQLYTIREDYSIERLDIADRQHLFASGGSRHAIEFEPWGDAGFKLEYYDNSAGKTFTNHYAWTNNHFKSASEQ
ncbi:hypothetical protein D3P09_21850 [Paenibacillus pinisoli]|uniref:VCBS repeat-containing protein n=1 Tax=Paenibacillus pinisoli TaxID=1276110 RepID=A0A3A6P9L5_9BACL|nr:hypothetical protein [Paenibacillus pinisoli]RJX37622.1 hypothetical protein D3P09_21850 [Paenibacillus pinisoli]